METTLDAAKACRRAGIAGLFSAFITAVFAGLAFAGVTGENLSDRFTDYFDPYLIVDAVLISVLAVLTWLRSRAAALTLFAYFLCAKVAPIASGEVPSGIILGLVFIYFFFQGIRGAYRFHALIRAENGNANGGAVVATGVGVVGIVCVVAMYAFVLLENTGKLISPETVFADDAAVYEPALRDAGILGDEENALAFYSIAFADPGYEGNLVTDQRVVSWETQDAERLLYEIALDEVAFIEVDKWASALSDATIGVFGEDGTGLRVLFAGNANADRKVVALLEERTGVAHLDLVENPPLPDVVSLGEDAEAFRERLQRIGQLDEGETPLAFFSTAGADAGVEGNLVTDQRVRSWNTTEDGASSYSIELPKIAAISVRQWGSAEGYTWIQLSDESGENAFYIVMPILASGDRMTLALLKERTGLEWIDDTQSAGETP